jgi:hypothetical protein
MNVLHYLKQNWGDFLSAIGMVISIITLLRVTSITNAQRQERDMVRKVLDLEELHITLEESITILNAIITESSSPDGVDTMALGRTVGDRINALARTSEKFKGALQALSTVRGDEISIASSHIEKGKEQLSVKNYTQAHSEFRKAKSFYELLPSPDKEHGLMEVYYYLARCSFGAREQVDTKQNLYFLSFAQINGNLL